MGAGILPTAIHNGKLYFLFGKENKYADTPGFSDIGGGQDGNETFLECAIREGTEELTGFLGSEEELAAMIKRGTYNIDFNNNKYRMHLLPVKYDPALPHYYNNNSKFIHKHLDPEVIKKSKIFEKSEIRWMCIDELHKMRGQFRSYFQDTVDMIIARKRDIHAFMLIRDRSVHKTRVRTRVGNKTRNRTQNKTQNKTRK